MWGSGIDSPDPGPSSITGAFEWDNGTLAQFFVSSRAVNSLSKIMLHGCFYVIKLYWMKSECVSFLNTEEKWETGIRTAPAVFG